MSFLEEALLNPGAAPEVYPEDRRAAAEEGRAAAAAAASATDESAAAAAAAPIEMRAWGNTGPKGVLQDYRDAEARLAQRMEAKAAAARAQAVRNSFTVRSAREEDAEDDDAEAFARYRAARIAELQQQKQQQQQQRQQWVRRLGTYDYMETVQGADPERFVVVHIFAPGVPACAALGRVLAALARRVGSAEGCVDFHDISLADALDAFDEDALPAVLVYRRGQPLHCHLRVAPAALERLLVADGVIDEPEQQPHRRGGDDDDEDEDDESGRHSSSGDEDDD